MKKYICLFGCICLLLLGGCSSSNSYERDKSAGSVATLSIKELEKKMEEKETFTVVFTQSWCSHCKAFLSMLDTYLEEHHVIVHDVVLDSDADVSQEEAVTVAQSYFSDLDSTPIVYYVEKGEVKDRLIPGDEGLTEEKFDTWVQKHQIDKKE